MALPSYMSRREGRYYLQVRLARPLAALIGVPLYRASLRTCDYRQARLRLAECLAWIYRMNDSVDYPDLIEKNVAQLHQRRNGTAPYASGPSADRPLLAGKLRKPTFRQRPRCGSSRVFKTV